MQNSRLTFGRVQDIDGRRWRKCQVSPGACLIRVVTIGTHGPLSSLRLAEAEYSVDIPFRLAGWQPAAGNGGKAAFTKVPATCGSPGTCGQLLEQPATFSSPASAALVDMDCAGAAVHDLRKDTSLLDPEFTGYKLGPSLFILYSFCKHLLAQYALRLTWLAVSLYASW